MALLVKSLPCGRFLSARACEAVSQTAIRKKIPKLETLWSMGDRADFVAIIVSGAVEISKTSVDGQETCLGIFGCSDAVGISAALARTEYPATARSIAKNTEIIKIFVRPLLQGGAEPWYEELSQWLRKLLLAHEHVLRDKIDVLSAGRVESRLIALFDRLIARFGEAESKKGFRIPFAISKTQIAKLIEVRPETVIRTLSHWQKKSWIQFKDEQIFICDLKELQSQMDASE